jgi:hypothetical protein
MPNTYTHYIYHSIHLSWGEDGQRSLEPRLHCIVLHFSSTHHTIFVFSALYKNYPVFTLIFLASPPPQVQSSSNKPSVSIHVPAKIYRLTSIIQEERLPCHLMCHSSFFFPPHLVKQPCVGEGGGRIAKERLVQEGW